MNQKTIFLFLVSLLLFSAGCSCVEKQGECCKGSSCSIASISCIEGTHPVFKGCSNDCSPNWECIGNPEEGSYNFSAIKNPEKMLHNTLNLYKPADWKEVNLGIMAFEYLPPGSDAGNPLSEKITIVVEFLAKNDTRTMSQIIEEKVKENQKILPDLREEGIRETRGFGSLDGLKIVYKASIQENEIAITQVNAIQNTMTYQDNIYYRIGYLCKKGECHYMDVFNEMVSSFEPKEPKT